MREELEHKIYSDFPALYSQRFGFECGDGWYNLIDRLSFEIAKIIATDEKLDPRLYTASQVKEKFGRLRFYMKYTTEQIDAEIRKASAESEKICEMCGADGKMRTGDWIWVMCDPCGLERQRRQEEERQIWNRRDSSHMDLD